MYFSPSLLVHSLLDLLAGLQDRGNYVIIGEAHNLLHTYSD